VELAEQRRRAERQGIVEDHDRIARDLHDLVIQRLFATGMLLVGATRIIDNPEAAGRVARAVDQLDGTIKDIRSTIFSLQTREGTPRDKGLRARVLAVIEESADTLGIAPTLRMDGLLDTRVSERLADQLLAALREALANVAKHARASRVEVVVSVKSMVGCFFECATTVSVLRPRGAVVDCATSRCERRSYGGSCRSTPPRAERFWSGAFPSPRPLDRDHARGVVIRRCQAHDGKELDGAETSSTMPPHATGDRSVA
jgi:hypothetical protein